MSFAMSMASCKNYDAEHSCKIFTDDISFALFSGTYVCMYAVLFMHVLIDSFCVCTFIWVVQFCVITGAAPWSAIPVLSLCLLLCITPSRLPPTLIQDQQALTVRIVPSVFLSVGPSLEEYSLTQDLHP